MAINMSERKRERGKRRERKGTIIQVVRERRKNGGRQRERGGVGEEELEGRVSREMVC